MTMFRYFVTGNVKVKMSRSCVEILCRYASFQAFPIASRLAVLFSITSSAMPGRQMDVQNAVNLFFFPFSETWSL